MDDPTTRSTERPTESALPLSDGIYYPDSKQNLCRTVTAGSGVTRFGSIEKCCEHPWMAGEWAQCVEDSIELRDMTPDPTRNPTRPPTRPPTRRPVEVDEPDKTPTGGVGGRGDGVDEEMVFYPDFDLGVCRWDGKHQNSPYRFSNAKECCSNRLMDYETCMSHADPYGIGAGEDDEEQPIPTASCRWYPNPLKFGSCIYSPHYPPEWDVDESMFLYDTHSDCCLGAFLQGGCVEELACGGGATGSSGGGGAGGGSVPSGSSSTAPTTL